MTGRTGPWRRGPAAGLATGLALLLLGVAPAVAQEPPPRPAPDTVPADTLPPPDGVPADVEAMPPVEAEADEEAEEAEEAEPVPPPELVRFPDSPEDGWAHGVWVWDRDALLSSTAITLNELLEQVPGIRRVRSGYYTLPEGLAAFGTAGGRTEVVLDGFVLDPLAEASHDLARFELVQLSRIRVERRLDVLRIEVETLAPTDARPFTMIEAGTGDLRTNLFRGLFLAPRVVGGPLGLGFERLSTDGLGRNEPGQASTTWAKWGLMRGSSGIQVEWRRTSFDRSSGAPSPGSGARRDVVLRARTQPLPGLTAEAYTGSASVEHEFADTLTESVTQSGVRAAFHHDNVWLNTGVRFRNHDLLPGTELHAGGGVQLGGRVSLAGDVERADWENGEPATHYEVRARVGPLLGLSGVASFAGGRRGVPFLLDDDGAPVLTERTAHRLGAEFRRGGFHLGAAALTVETDRVASFGFSFDEPAALFPGGRVSGFEVVGRLPLFLDPFSLEGSFTQWYEGERWIYLPENSLRAALVYRHLPLESGNLEIRGRLEVNSQGAMLVPLGGGGTEHMPAYSSLDAHLQIRILDVRIFLRWENLLARRDHADLPGRIIPGPRATYGVKWQFWN